MKFKEPTLARLRKKRVSVVHDPVDNSRWQLLRAVPALYYLGVADFTYPTTWRQIEGYTQQDYLGFEYRHLTEMEPGSELPEKLGIVTNDHYEKETTHSVSGLVERYASGDDSLVVVTDSRDFTPVGRHRPLDQEQFADRAGTYNRIYRAFENRYERFGYELPLSDTQNLFVQDNALLYEFVTDDSLGGVRELFDVLPDAPVLPLYDTFTDLFARPEEYGTVPLDSKESIDDVARWLRRRIELDRGTAREIVNSYNKQVAEDGTTFDPAHANQSPELERGRTAAKDLDAEESPVDARFEGWLTRSVLDTG